MLIGFVRHIGSAGILGLTDIAGALLQVFHNCRHHMCIGSLKIRFSAQKTDDFLGIVDSVVLHIAESATVSYTRVGTG
jgi:hypothetical protein